MNQQNSTLKIGIIGYGVVGKAVDNTFSKHFQVLKYDKYNNLDSFNSLYDCDFVFLTVPTPFNHKKRMVDDSAIIESLQRLQEINFNNIVIIKSTLSPGLTETYITNFGLKIVFNPEFLRESTTPNEDFANQDTIVIGTEDEHLFDEVENLYKQVAVDKAHYFMTTSTEAELVKCAQNTMLASRVALANMIYDSCMNLGVDYNKLRKIAFDRFEILGPHMVQVPGSDGKRGFGGKCLPKDILAFSTIHDSSLLKEIISYNNSLRDDLEES